MRRNERQDGPLQRCTCNLVEDGKSRDEREQSVVELSDVGLRDLSMEPFPRPCCRNPAQIHRGTWARAPRYGVQKLRVLARSGNSSFRPSSTVPRFTTPMVLASCTLSQALLSVPVSPVPLNRADRAHSLAPEVAVQLRSTPESSVHSGLRSPGRGRRGRYPTRTVGLLHLSWSVPPRLAAQMLLQACTLP